MKAEKEAIVELPLVNVRAVLHLALLCHQAQGKDKGDERDNAPQCSCMHQNNNVCKPLFIAQITVFGDKEEKKSDFSIPLSLKIVIFAPKKTKK